MEIEILTKKPQHKQLWSSMCMSVPVCVSISSEYAVLALFYISVS